MRKKDFIIVIIIALIVFIPIIINEVNEYNLRKLKKEVLKISEVLENSSKNLKEIEINKELKISDKIYTTKGKGKAFIDDQGVIVVLSYKNYCAVKIPSINEVALSKSDCPDYQLIKGTIVKVVQKDGLVKVNDNYYYKGKADNYLLFNKELWYILGFENNKIKIIKEEPLDKRSQRNAFEYLNKDYYNSLDKSKISDHDYDLSSVIIKSKIENNILKTEKLHIGILSIFDYINTLNEACKSKTNALICGKSFITKPMWLSNYNEDKSYYLYDDENIYMGDSNLKKEIYPVLYLNEDVDIKSGYGTKSEPYTID